MKATLGHIYLCRTANMSWRTCVVVKQIQSNPIQLWAVSNLYLSMQIMSKNLAVALHSDARPELFAQASDSISLCRFESFGHTKSHILSRGPLTACHHCGQTLSIDHMLLECAVLQECCDEYYTVDSLNTIFEKIPETCIVEFLREAGLFYVLKDVCRC